MSWGLTTLFKRKNISKIFSNESINDSQNDLTEIEQEILSSTLQAIMKKETILIQDVLQSKLNDVKKDYGGHQNDG